MCVRCEEGRGGSRRSDGECLMTTRKAKDGLALHRFRRLRRPVDHAVEAGDEPVRLSCKLYIYLILNCALLWTQSWQHVRVVKESDLNLLCSPI